MRSKNHVKLPFAPTHYKIRPMLTKQTLTLLTLALSSSLIALLMLEGGLRLLPSPPILFENYGETYVCSPTVGWLGGPHYQGLLTREEYSHPIQFNGAGMYDHDHDLAKPPHTWRILWVGDSFAQALQVDEKETAHQQLETMLNERLGSAEQQFEVINLGMMGWGTAQELAYYREQGQRYQADAVVVMFFMGNDVNDNLPGHALTIDGFNCFAPYFPVCNNQLDPTAWAHVPGLDPAWNSCSTGRYAAASGLSFLQQNSYLWARLEPLLLSWQPRRSYGQEFGLSFAALYLPQESEEVRYGWQVTEGLLQQFQQETAANQSKLGVAIIGPREVVWLATLNDAQRQTFYDSAPAFKTAQIDYPNQRLLTFLQQHNIPTLDLQPPMIDYTKKTGAPLYLPIDRHWTVEGNRVAAELMYNWLVAQNLVPTASAK